MKGKIRVFCRVRPLIKSVNNKFLCEKEIEKNCKSCVSIVDDFTIQLDSKNGLKQFNYDSCF